MVHILMHFIIKPGLSQTLTTAPLMQGITSIKSIGASRVIAYNDTAYAFKEISSSTLNSMTSRRDNTKVCDFTTEEHLFTMIWKLQGHIHFVLCVKLWQPYMHDAWTWEATWLRRQFCIGQAACCFTVTQGLTIPPQESLRHHQFMSLQACKAPRFQLLALEVRIQIYCYIDIL